MSDYTELFTNSPVSKPYPVRLYCTKSSNSSPFHNQHSPRLLNSFIDLNLRKDLASSPTGSASYREDRSPLGLQKDGLKTLNYNKFTLYGGEKVSSLTWRNEANTENIDSQNNFLNMNKDLDQPTRKTSELRDNLFAMISKKHREEKEASPKSPKRNLYRMNFKSQNQSLTSDCSLTLKKQLTDSKLKEVSTSTSKVIDADQKKIDAQLCLGESLNLSNISESPHEGKADNKQGNFGSMVEETKKRPISDVYRDLLKKHMTNPSPSVTSRQNTKRTSAKMVNGRPQTCKDIPVILPNPEKNTLSSKEKQYLSALQKFKNGNIGSPREIKPSKPAPRVASARVATPKAEVREPVIAIRDDKPQKRNSPKKIVVPRPEAESLKEVASCIPLRAKKDLLHSVSNYKFERVLGHGGYAVVKLAWDKVRAEKVAVKVYEKNVVLDPRKMKNVRREISILKDMDHPNIIKLLDSFDTPKQVYVVMEFVGKASLHSYLKSLGSKKLEESEIKRIFRQVCSGMKYCHQKNIVHRDIKMENILIDDNNNAKIIDFGFSMNISYDKRLDTYCGTPSYMAPEIVTKTPYKGAPADIWALGVLVYVLLCGHYPFKGTDDRDLSHKIRKAKVEFPSQISEEAKAFVQKLLRANPDERLRIDEVLQEKWLNN